MKVCPECKANYDEEYFFCENDGNKLVTEENKSNNPGIGDGNIITGDIEMKSPSMDLKDSEIGIDSTDISIGDKNIISGDINVENTTNIGNLIINKDETNEVIKCAASGRSIRIIESFQCSKCNQSYHNDYLSESLGVCRFCDSKTKEDQTDRLRDMIRERLSDLVIDEQEMDELSVFAKSVGFSSDELIKLISEIKNEMIANGADRVSDQDQEVLKLCRLYFDSFNMSKLHGSIRQLYPKYKNLSEVRFYNYTSLGIEDVSKFNELRKQNKHDDLELFKANYFSGMYNGDFDTAAYAISQIRSSFPNDVFPKLMQFDLELNKFLNNPFSQDEFSSLQEILPGFLKQNIKFEEYAFEESLQRFFQGLYVLLFKMPLTTLFDKNILEGLKQISGFGYNRFIKSRFWIDSLKNQNEIFRVLRVSGNNNKVSELCEFPLLKALHEFEAGMLNEVIDSDEFKMNELDPKVKDSFDKEFIDSSKRIGIEKTIPFTDIVIDNNNGISVPISLKFKAQMTVKDLGQAAEVFGGNGKLNEKTFSKLVEKLIVDLFLSDFSNIMSQLELSLHGIGQKSSEISSSFIALQNSRMNEDYGIDITEFIIVRITPDKESEGYIRASNTSKPPVAPFSNNTYHISVNNVNYGPYSLQQLSDMIKTHQFNKNTMVWCEGMSQWDYAMNVSELNNLF